MGHEQKGPYKHHFKDNLLFVLLELLVSDADSVPIDFSGLIVK